MKAVVATVVLVLAGCTGGGGGGDGGGGEPLAAPAPPTTLATTSTLPLIDVMEVEQDGCVPFGGGGAAAVGGQPGADPYALPGARQRPGPDMTTLPVAGEVRAVEVVRPGDPDANSPAKTPTTIPGTPTTVTTTTLPPPTTLPAPASADAGPSCVELP